MIGKFVETTNAVYALSAALAFLGFFLLQSREKGASYVVKIIQVVLYIVHMIMLLLHTVKTQKVHQIARPILCVYKQGAM